MFKQSAKIMDKIFMIFVSCTCVFLIIDAITKNNQNNLASECQLFRSKLVFGRITKQRYDISMYGCEKKEIHVNVELKEYRSEENLLEEEIYRNVEFVFENFPFHDKKVKLVSVALYDWQQDLDRCGGSGKEISRKDYVQQ